MTGYQAIVLAAGAGRRFGGRKLLVHWRNRPLIVWAAEQALATAVDEVVVVLGCDHEALSKALAAVIGPRLRTTYAPDWPEGMAASIRAGVAQLPQQSRGFLLFLGDMPALPPELPAAVLRALQNGAAAVRPTYRGAPAHPVGFSSAFYPGLKTLSGDHGAGHLLENSSSVLLIQTQDSGSIMDIDRPDDLA